MEKMGRIPDIKERIKSICKIIWEHEWIYAFTGTDDDITHFISVTLLDPPVAVLTVYYITGYELNLLLVYLIMDTLTITWWVKHAQKRKKELEEEANKDQLAIVLEKLKEMEQEEKEQKRNSQL